MKRNDQVVVVVDNISDLTAWTRQKENIHKNDEKASIYQNYEIPKEAIITAWIL